MKILHNIILIFFTCLIIYSFIFKNIVEGLDINDPIFISKTTASDILSIQKELNELNDVEKRINNIDALTKSNSNGISQLREKFNKI